MAVFEFAVIERLTNSKTEVHFSDGLAELYRKRLLGAYQHKHWAPSILIQGRSWARADSSQCDAGRFLGRSQISIF